MNCFNDTDVFLYEKIIFCSADFLKDNSAIYLLVPSTDNHNQSTIKKLLSCDFVGYVKSNDVITLSAYSNG